jgi:hypothetical protein
VGLFRNHCAIISKSRSCENATLEYDAGDRLWRRDRACRGLYSNPSLPGANRNPARRSAKELIGATLAFGLLCGLAAAMRNFILRRLTGSESG